MTLTRHLQVLKRSGTAEQKAQAQAVAPVRASLRRRPLLLRCSAVSHLLSRRSSWQRATACWSHCC